MIAQDRLVDETFRSSTWREVTEGLFDALGVSIVVADARLESTVHVGPRSGYCEAVLGEAGTVNGRLACFDAPASPSDDCERLVCRAGLECRVTALELEGEVTCHLILSGFVGASHERERLLSRALASGVPDVRAQTLVRGLPVYSARRVDGIVRGLVAQADTLLSAAKERHDAMCRAADLELLLDVGRELTDSLSGPAGIPSVLLARSIELLGADGGSVMLLRPGSDILDVVACSGTAAASADGKSCRVGEGLAGRAAACGGTLLSEAGNDADCPEPAGAPGVGHAALSVPLRTSAALLGVLTLERSSGEGFTRSDLGIAEGFAAFASTALQAARFQAETQHELAELTQLDEVTLALHGGLEVSELTPQVSSVLEKSIDFAIGGIVLDGFGVGAGAISVNGEWTTGDVRHVIAEARGVDESECDIDAFCVSSHLGGLVEGTTASREDWCVVSAELMVRDVVAGCLFVASPQAGAFNYRDARILRRLAAHVALAFDRSALLDRVRSDYAKTIAALSAAMDIGERMERGHTDRVMDYSMAIGEEMCLGYQEIEVLRFAGLLHDVGKVGLSETILVKPSKLTEEEWVHVRKHSEIGAGIVSEIRFLNSIAPVVLHHHERWDGKGYPMGLVGSDTPLLARILGVADAYDAMCSETAYRKALSPARARVELEQGAGTQFDPEVVRALLDVLDRRAAVGASGLLSFFGRRGSQLPA